MCKKGTKKEKQYFKLAIALVAVWSFCSRNSVHKDQKARTFFIVCLSVNNRQWNPTISLSDSLNGIERALKESKMKNNSIYFLSWTS